jgi:hypothetical protein
VLRGQVVSLPGLFGAEFVTDFGESSSWTGFVGIIVAIVQFVAASGQLATKEWAWILALVGVWLTVVEGVIGLFTSGPFGFMCGSLGLITPALILVYLLLPGTLQAFE